MTAQLCDSLFENISSNFYDYFCVVDVTRMDSWCCLFSIDFVLKIENNHLYRVCEWKPESLDKRKLKNENSTKIVQINRQKFFNMKDIAEIYNREKMYHRYNLNIIKRYHRKKPSHCNDKILTFPLLRCSLFVQISREIVLIPF